MKSKLYLGWMLFIFAGACGGETPQTIALPADDQSSNRSPRFDLNRTWTISSKQCGGVAVPDAEALEVYRLDAEHLVRIEKISEDEQSLCKVGYVYDRVSTSVSEKSGDYQESGYLRSSLAKRTCWTKNGDILETPPFRDEVIGFGPEQTSYSLQATELTLILHIKAGASCRSDLLVELR